MKIGEEFDALSASGLHERVLGNSEELGVGRRRSQAEALEAVAANCVIIPHIRREILGHALASEHVWDILLTLYLNAARNKRTCVTDVANATGIPAATAIRMLNLLTDKGMVCREKDDKDARRSWLSLSPRGVSTTEKCLAAIDRATGFRPLRAA